MKSSAITLAASPTPITGSVAVIALVSSMLLTQPSSATLRAQDTASVHGHWRGSVGALGGSLASYYGGDARRTLAGPVLGLAYKERLLIGTTTNGGLGGGVEMIVRQGIVGTSLGLTGVEARPEDRGDALAGMDDRSGAVFGTVGLVVRAGLARATATTAVGLRHNAGLLETLGLQVGGTVAPRLVATVGGAATFADRDNMAFDFGITDEQAARRRELIAAGDRRLRAGDTTTFSPKSGLKEMRGTVQLAYTIRGPWQAVGLVSVGSLSRDIADSPLARTRSAVTTAFGVTFGF
jgi:outer membrane scaffolding protein for murein synthesis (MipA/OmpV family)